MRIRSIPRLSPWLLAGLLGLARLAVADEPDTTGGQNAVGDLAAIKQAEARKKLQALEETMNRLSRLLETTEPDRAAKLRSAFRESRERLLREGMDRVVRFIEERKFYEALERQGSISGDLDELLSILLEKDIDPRELMRQIRRLRDVVQDLDAVIREETGEKIASDDALVAAEAAEELASRAERLEEMIGAQRAIEEAARELAEGASGPSKPSPGGKPAEDGDGEARSGKVAEATALDELAARQEALRRRLEKLAGEASPDGESGDSGESGSTDSGELSRAGESMKSASGAMRERQPRPAQAHAAEAREALERARGEAAEKLERLRKLRDFERLKKDQDSTRGKTQDIARRMEETPPLTVSPEGGVPGRKDVESASGSMEQASDQLGQGRPGRASPSQEDALQKLRRGRERAEQTLEDLQKALRERILAYLRERITFMLEKQQRISRDTQSLDARLRALTAAASTDAQTLSADREVDRRDLQRARGLSRREGALATIAQDVVDLLEEDGTTVAFPQIVGQVRTDLENVEDLLSRVETGGVTRRLQADIEATLEQILDAIKEAQKNPPPPDPNQGRQSRNGSGPLLPPSSELKMVLSMQRRVNKRTRDFDLDRQPGQLTAEEERQARAISDAQGEIKRLLQKIARSLGER